MRSSSRSDIDVDGETGQAQRERPAAMSSFAQSAQARSRGLADAARLEDLANASAHTLQLKAFHDLANAGPRANPPAAVPAPGSAVLQRVVTQTAARWVSSMIPDRSFDTRVQAQEAEDAVYRRAASMLPMPLAFGAGAPYGFHELGMPPVARGDVERIRNAVGDITPMLHTLAPQNRLFNTSEPPRAPTMYFEERGTDAHGQPVRSTGRVRQEHDDGPAAYIDRRPRTHLFSSDQRMLDVEDEHEMRQRGIAATTLPGAQPGMHHIEVQHLNPWEVAHASGGTLSTEKMTEEDVDRAILAAVIAPNVKIADRR